MAIDIDVERRFGASVIGAQFTAEAGLTALFGPSGVGKTSLLNMVAGLLRPDRGHIRIGGRTLFDDATDLPPEARRVGYVFQDGRLFPHRRVKANLLYGWRLADPANRWMTLDEAADFLGIGHLLGRWPQSLSGGEAQRVAIGRALLAAPHILLMDEPLSSLDAARRDDIMTVIERIRDELKVPILYVSHDRAEVDRLATQIVELGK
ncbi:MAG TPA: ATP-binding cassette domain-containing protein [Sphingopyxis terrae]|nr:ATP-binding cassette domain-containing protein [Sphingopyxis terrae]